MESEARLLGLARLFSLTTHTPHWFIEHGFVPGSIEDLPMAKQQLYNYQRNSRVIIKPLKAGGARRTGKGSGQAAIDYAVV